jgi:hypothetical protein
MRVALWESFANRGTGDFNGFSIKLSEDTRQGDGYHAQSQGGQPQGYGQPQGNGYTAPQTGYSAPQSGYAPQQPPQPPQQGYPAQAPSYGQQGPQQPLPPVAAYQNGDEGYVPGFDD